MTHVPATSRPVPSSIPNDSPTARRACVVVGQACRCDLSRTQLSEVDPQHEPDEGPDHGDHEEADDGEDHSPRPSSGPRTPAARRRRPGTRYCATSPRTVQRGRDGEDGPARRGVGADRPQQHRQPDQHQARQDGHSNAHQPDEDEDPPRSGWWALPGSISVRPGQRWPGSRAVARTRRRSQPSRPGAWEGARARGEHRRGARPPSAGGRARRPGRHSGRSGQPRSGSVPVQLSRSPSISS